MMSDFDDNPGTPRGGWNLKERTNLLFKSGELFYQDDKKEIIFLLLTDVHEVIIEEDLSDDFWKFDTLKFSSLAPCVCELLFEDQIIRRMSVDLRKYTKI